MTSNVPSGSDWDSLQRRAKYLEARLESKINRYSQLAQKLNADYLCDEENPLIESKEEQEYASDIERDLAELSECLTSMKNTKPTIPMHQYESLIKRYHEIHFDHCSEFNNISNSIQRKRTSQELFKHSRKSENEQDSSLSRLIKESSAIKSSMKSINEVISQAFDTKNMLTSQKTTLQSSTGGLTTLSSNVPTFNRLIDGIQKKKARESAILASVIGSLLCITVWWVFLR